MIRSMEITSWKFKSKKLNRILFLKCNDMVDTKGNVTLISIQLFIRLFVIRKTMRAKSVESLCL